MKTKKLLLVLFATILTVSCNNNDTCYSCDKELNNFVKDNLSRLDELTRAEISAFPGNKQRAVYAGLTPERRKEIWLEKFAQIKTLTFNPAELNMINHFEDFVRQKDFSQSITATEETNLNALKTICLNDLGWSQKFIVSAFGYLGDIDNNGLLRLPAGGSFGGGDDPDCDCKWGLGCLDGPCVTNGCKATEDGCGWFNQQVCAAICRPDL